MRADLFGLTSALQTAKNGQDMPAVQGIPVVLVQPGIQVSAYNVIPPQPNR